VNRPRLPDADTLPWYRHFWPWFLILLPGSVVVAALATLFIAQRGADDLVADDYYRQGLAINRQLALGERAADLGISAELSLDTDRVDAHILGPVEETQLELSLSHPLEADHDVELTLARTGPGRYSATLPLTSHGATARRWHWSLQPREPAPWRLVGVLHTTDDGGKSQP